MSGLLGHRPTDIENLQRSALSTLRKTACLGYLSFVAVAVAH